MCCCSESIAQIREIVEQETPRFASDSMQSYLEIMFRLREIKRILKEKNDAATEI